MSRNPAKINIFHSRHRRYGPQKKWDIAAINQLMELVYSGKGWEAIAAEMGRSIYSVQYKSRALGITRSKRYQQTNLTPGIPKRNWTDKEVRTLRKEWLAGTSVATIAKLLGKTKEAVSCQAYKRKLPHRYVKFEYQEGIQELYDAGVAIRQIAKQYNVTDTTLAKVLSRGRFRSALTDDEKTIIEERYADGCSFGCIARRIRRNPATVYKYIQAAELKQDVTPLDDLVRDLCAEKSLTVDQIAIKLELPRQSIMAAIKRNERASR